jgi:uncharacterized membrane protein
MLAVTSTRPGAIQAVDAKGLIAAAVRHDCVLVLARSVGDFVPPGTTLIEVPALAVGGVLDDDEVEKLRGFIAQGDERTIEQDPAFAIRIMVDIAERALSPAVNDPTTAVQVINHLADLLRLIGTVDLSGARWSGARDCRSGIVTPVRDWEEYLSLGTTEIREYGATSIQVMRRMRAMLEELRGEVLEPHRAAVVEELSRLDATVARQWGDSVDFDRASRADNQGIGGRVESQVLSR